MTGEEWAALVGGTIAAIAGSVAVVVRALRPAPKLKPGVTQSDLDAVRNEMRELVRVAVKTVEEACEAQNDSLRERFDEHARAFLERVHALDLKIERLATSLDEREPRRSRRSGQ